MKKKLLFIVDPLADLDVKTDTTLALIEESCARGFDNFACEMKDVFLKNGVLHFLAAPIELARGYQGPPGYLGSPRVYPADNFQIVFMRKDPPVDSAFLSTLLLLQCHDEKKTKVLNSPDGVLLANEKLFGQRIAPQFFPPTLVSMKMGVIREFVERNRRVVLKPLFNAGGSGVLVFDHEDRNLSSALELLTSSFTMPVMVQGYIADARDGDKRIIVLGGKAVGAIMRIPQEGDHRANFHAGGSACAAVIDERDLQIVSHLAPHLLRLGLHLVGIDVIGGYLTEINVTSPTCVIEIEKMSQAKGEKPLREQIMDYVTNLIA